MQTHTTNVFRSHLFLLLAIAAISCIAQTPSSKEAQSPRLETPGTGQKPNVSSSIDDEKLAQIRASLEAQQWAQAIAQARPLADETQPANIRLPALENLAVALAGAGDAEESERVAIQAQALFSEQETARLAKSSVYQRNRSTYEGLDRHAISLLRRRQAAAEAGGHAKQSVPTAVALAVRFPQHPDRRAFSLAAAERLLELGRPDEATPWFLAALDTGLDRSFGTKCKYRDNQVQLDAVTLPPSSEHVRRVLAGLAPEKAENEDGEQELPHSATAERLHSALLSTKSLDTEQAIDVLSLLLSDTPFDKTPLADIIRLEIARTHLRVGHAQEATRALQKIEPERTGFLKRRTAWGQAVEAQCAFLRGMAASLMLDRRAAADHFAAAAALGGAPLADAAHCEQARCLELDGQWKAARRLYRKLAEGSPATSTRRYAGIALARLDDLGALPFAYSNIVTQLPDDRETHGDWYLGYGEEHSRLCAHAFSWAIIDGSQPQLRFAFSTSDPDEPGRGWVSAKTTEDPAALWNPLIGGRVPANRDDRGEAYPVGAGPDLLIDVPPLPGQHVLSLYFVNDHHYYEANRRYTIEVRSGSDLLALADVRDFGTGTYKRFLVDGLQRLRLRVRRDASMNVLLQGVFLDCMPTLDAVPLAEEPGDTGLRHLQSLVAERMALDPRVVLSRPSSLLAAASVLAASERTSAAQLHFVSRLLLASGRPRSSYRAFAVFAAAIPPNQAIAAANVIGKRFQAVDPYFRRRIRQWPGGSHPLDLLNERWFADYYPLVAPPDQARVQVLVQLFRTIAPGTTPTARKRAYLELDKHAPRTLTAPLLESAATLFSNEGDRNTAALLYRRALDSCPQPKTEFLCAAQLLSVAKDAKLPLADIQPLYERALQAARACDRSPLVNSAHERAARAFAAYGQYEKALECVNRSTNSSASASREQYEDNLRRQKEGRNKTR